MAGLHDQRRSKHDELGTVLDEGLKLLAGKKIKPLGECPDPETFVRFVQGQVDAETQKSINSHIAFCDECYREYLALANPEDIRTPHEDPDAKKTVITADTPSGLRHKADSSSSGEYPAPGAPRVAGHLTLFIRNVKGVVVVQCVGRIVVGVEASFLRDVVKGLLDSHEGVVLDLSNVMYMDSAGIGTLAGLHASAICVQKRITLAGLSQLIGEAFQASKQVGVLEIVDTVETAVARQTSAIRYRRA